MLAHLDTAKVSDSGDFRLILGQAAAGAEFLDFFFTGVWGMRRS